MRGSGTMIYTRSFRSVTYVMELEDSNSFGCLHSDYFDC